MIIELAPFIPRFRRNLSLEVSGDVLHLVWTEGSEHKADYEDFSEIEEGDVVTWDDEDGADPCPWWLVGSVTRKDGEIVVRVKFPVETGCSKDAAFPAPIRAGDGAVPLPDPRGPREKSPKFLPRDLPDPTDPTIP